MKPKPHPKTDHAKYELTAEELRGRMRYEPETGEFIWLVHPTYPKEWNNLHAGKPAKASICRAGRRAMNLTFAGKKRHYYAANLAWLYVTGSWPSIEIDHINTDAGDDRWCNLRPASSAQNKWNMKVSRRSTTGVKGVSLDKRRGTYSAETKAGPVRHRLSGFATIEEAAAARAASITELHGEFARLA